VASEYTVRVHFIDGSERIVPAKGIHNVGEEGARSATTIVDGREVPIYNRVEWGTLWHEQAPPDSLSFEEEINPANWIEETGLHTPTFEAKLLADGTLWLSGAALREGFSVEAVQALTRFLSERVKLPPLEPPYDFSDFTPKRIDTESEDS